MGHVVLSVSLLIVGFVCIQAFAALGSFKAAQTQMLEAATISNAQDHTLLVFDGLEPSSN